MTRQQMIDLLNDYCNKNICDSSCEFVYECKRNEFSEMTDDELKSLVKRIGVTVQINQEQENTFEVGEKMEQVKVLKKATKIFYPNGMKDVLPLEEFVKNITDKGYKVELTKDNVVSDTVVNIYKEVEMKE